MKRLLVAIGFLAFSSLLFAQADNGKLVSDANKAYTAGKFNNAIELYQKVIAAGYESAGLYYNLGNSYFKVNDIPSAIFYYEKSLKLRPGNENTEFNLKVAQTRIVDKIDELPRSFFYRFWNALRSLFSVTTWGILSITGLLLTLVMAAFYLLAGRVWLRKLTFWIGTFLLAGTVLANIAAYAQYQHMQSTPQAIIFDPTVHVKSSPDNNSVDIFVIHEGTKVTITDELGEWNEIRIANGSIGWIKASAMKQI